MNGNKIIEASAGTGKTQRLASRIISLMRAGARPQEIVALTFSRAAAGEIFERFVHMLAKSAKRRASDIALLRQVIDTQHLSQIGTLDSFLMRMARAFPLELGLCGEIQIMDESRANIERAKTSFSILRRTDETSRRHFAEAFSLAMNREVPRSFIAAYNKFVEEWHNLVLECPQEDSWDCAERIFGGEVPEWANATEADLARAAEEISAIRPGDASWEAFACWVGKFRGRLSGLKGIAAKVMSLSKEELSRAVIEFKFGNRPYAIAGEDAQRLRNAVHLIAGYCLRQRIEETRGVYRLISAFEREYGARVRAKGNLVFGDVPRLVCSLPEHVRRNLEYRMDCRIRAWALDEFQDTSRPQWRAMADLIDEAKQSEGEKPIFIVGDFKQAIYGWREGDVSIFERECADEVYRKIPLNRTWRSGPAVVEAVNRVFAGGAMGAMFPRWKEKCGVHRTARDGLEGLVQAIDAPGAKKEDFLEPVYNALAAAKPVERGLEAAVLVRGNDLGRMVVNYLRGRGMKDVEFEGNSDSFETTALGGFLDLVELADHPGALMTWRHFLLTKLAAALYGGRRPQPDEISREFSRAFTTKGLVRTFRELREAIRRSQLPDWGEYVESQYVSMLKAAEEFELSMRSDTRLSDFRAFLESRRSQSCAASGKVRVMTIHHSKGLGFDYVVLPLYEHRGLGHGGSEGPIVGDGWVLGDPKEAGKHVDALAEAIDMRKRRKEFEELCTYYVAMTRAKRSMTVILHPRPKDPRKAATRFSDIVRESLGSPAEIGNRLWLDALKKPGKGGPAEPERPAEEERLDAPRKAPRRARQSFGHRLPSKGFVDGEVASVLFQRDSARRRAIERGVEAHKAFEAVDFIDAGQARDDFDRALVRPSGFTDLWRERSYEILSGGVWESGQFDRVVFAGGRAVIQDFKTNKPMRGESRGDFESRMAMTYRRQMMAYRRALETLANIPGEAISCELLLVSTRSVVSVDGRS